VTSAESKNRWREALDTYRYPVSLSAYKFRYDHEGWFKKELAAGDREETVGFEDQVRRQAPSALEAWYEVVFWKVASQPLIRNGTTQRIARNLAGKTAAEELWRKLSQYVDCDASEAKMRFREFIDLFDLQTDSIATVATFPAFMDPDRFPMIDTRIASWVSQEIDKHNGADPTGHPPDAPEAQEGRLEDERLRLHDFLDSVVSAYRPEVDAAGGRVPLESERRRNGSLSGLGRQESKTSPVTESSLVAADLIRGATYATAALTRAPDSSA
jgi:hypothetical protein